MTTYEKTVAIIQDQIATHRTDPPEQIARRCLEAMRAKRIVPHTLKASDAMFKRFHAHCAHLGNVTGRGYAHYYNEAIEHAMKTGDWPHKIFPRRIKVYDMDEHGNELETYNIVEVDIPIPESSTRATNGQLLAAYQVIQDEAREHGIELPEEG